MRRQTFVNAEDVPLEWRLRWGTQDLVDWAASMVGRVDGGKVYRPGDDPFTCWRTSGEIEVPS